MTNPSDVTEEQIKVTDECGILTNTACAEHMIMMIHTRQSNNLEDICRTRVCDTKENLGQLRWHKQNLEKLINKIEEHKN